MKHLRTVKLPNYVTNKNHQYWNVWVFTNGEITLTPATEEDYQRYLYQKRCEFIDESSKAYQDVEDIDVSELLRRARKEGAIE